MATKTYRVNGYNARVLSENKCVSFYTNKGMKTINVPVTKRVTKKFVENLIKTYEGVTDVYVRHSRYLVYRLRNVMSERSGEYNVWVDMKVEDGKVVTSKRKIENHMY